MRSFFFLLALLAETAMGAGPGGKINVISVGDAAKRLPSFTVLDSRGTKLFARGHLPGSRPIYWKDWTLEKANILNYVLGDAAKWGRVAEPDASLTERLRELGLSRKKPILVVGVPFEWGEEGRIAWNLLYWGAAEVWLLDGGYPAWVAAGKPVERGKAKPVASGDFEVAVRSMRRATLQMVKSAVAAKSRPLLDSRSIEEYEGKLQAGQARGGHVPGASLVPVDKLYRKDGTYVTAEELRRLLPTGFKKSPITYCTGGVRSALLALLLEARLDIPAANYDGSMWEWSSHPELPLVTK